MTNSRAYEQFIGGQFCEQSNIGGNHVFFATYAVESKSRKSLNSVSVRCLCFAGAPNFSLTVLLSSAYPASWCVWLRSARNSTGWEYGLIRLSTQVSHIEKIRSEERRVGKEGRSRWAPY